MAEQSNKRLAPLWHVIRIFLIAIGAVFAVLLVAGGVGALLLKQSKVQTFIVQMVTTELSDYLDADVSIARVYYRPWSCLALDSVYLSDRRRPKIEKLSEQDVGDLMNRTDEETIALMEQALQQLLPKDQSLIAMFYYEDLSLKEIAYITDSATTTVASRLCRIRHKMYHIIKELKYGRDI